ncbi:MAG TPA: insulinase family protein [Mariprofundaceae bacterium]|nr:insulinase family protein [Mariprofundaceae bacterium]
MRILLIVCSLFVLSVQAFSAPKVQQHVLDNGLNILLIEAHHVPMVAMKLVMPAGSRFDAENKGGSASLLASMLMDHTAKHDYQTWAAKLDETSIRLGAGVDKDALSLSLTVLKEMVDEGVGAMAQALLQPGWNQKRFDFIQQNTISGLTKAQEDAGTFAALAKGELLFPNHVYGHPASGTLDSVQNIHLKDLKQLYQQQVKPGGATLAISGDITMKEVILLMETHLGKWQGKPKVSLSNIAKPQPSEKQKIHHEMDKHQMLIEWVRLGPSRHNEGYISMMVLNHMLGGGGFGSLLMEEIREKRGLTYGVYSYFQPYETSGAYVIRLQTRADQADAAETVIQQVLQSLADGGITQDMLDKSKTNLMGGFAQRMDSNRERVGLLAMMGLYHRPLDYLENWTKSVESVTLAGVRRGAKVYFQPESWKQVWVGPAN